MKKLLCTTLALTMAVSLGATAMAEGPQLVIAPNPMAYATTIAVNGEELSTAGIPAGEGIPMRLVTEADYGFADWYADENKGFFSLDGNNIYVDFANGNSVELNGEMVEGVTAQVLDGVTFLPVDLIAGLEGYTVNKNPELDTNRIDIATPNGEPLVKLARQVMEASAMGNGMKTAPAELEQYHAIKQENFTEVVAFLPMMISADTVIVGKMADGKLDELKAEFEVYRLKQEDTFSWYLPQNLTKVQDARVEVVGDYVMFLIAEDADKGVELFQTWAKEQGKTEA